MHAHLAEHEGCLPPVPSSQWMIAHPRTREKDVKIQIIANTDVNDGRAC
jgi:hypothetical protein